MALGMSGKPGGSNDYYSAINNAGKAGLAKAKNMADLYQQGMVQGQKETDLGRRDQARQMFGDAWSSGDSQKIHAVMQMFPEFADKAQKMMGIQDDQQRKDMGNLAYTLQGLIESGDIDGAKGLVGQNSGLLSKFGGSDHVLSVLDASKGDENERGRLQNWLHSLEGVSLSSEERERNRQGDRGLDLREQGLENQFQLGQQRIGLQAQLGEQRNQLGWANLDQRKEWQNMTPGQREFQFFQGLPAEDQQKYLAIHGKGGAGGAMGAGLHPVQLSDGNTVQIDPKVHGAGASAFYQGKDADGNIINVPVSSVVTPVNAPGQAGTNAFNKDIGTLLDITPEDAEHITGFARGGGTGKMPFGADTYTGYKGGSARNTFNAANRIQGNMQNKGIAAAKEMGASGINTVAEAKLYFQSMPQLDYSSPDALKASAKTIKDYTDRFNTQHNVKYKPSAGKSASELSDEELLKGL